MMNFHINIRKLTKNFDRNFLIILFFSVFLLKLPTIYLDYHWDEAVFVAHSKYYSIYGWFSLPTPSPVLHVPLLNWIFSLNYILFGESPLISHIIIIVFSFIACYFTYLLGKNLYNREVGVVASILLLFSPMYFSLSGQALYEVPLTAMTVVVLYFLFKKNLIGYLISSSILVLTKEPGILIIGTIILFKLIKREKIKNVILYASPILLFFLWEFFFMTSTEHYLLSFDPLFSLKKLFANVYQTFFWNYHWILTVPIILLFFKKPFKNFRKNAILFLLIAVFIAFFSFAPTFLLPKYLLPIHPIIFLISAHSIDVLFKNKKNIFLFFVIILFISSYRWNWGIKGFIQDPVFHSIIFKPPELTSLRSGELSLDYIDIVNVETQTLDFVIKNYKNSKIMASYPLVAPATLEVNVGGRQWDKNNIKIFYPPSVDDITNVDLVIVESYGNWPDDVLKIVSGYDMIKEFKNNDKSVRIYQI